ncbi:MAG TPA: DUF3052 family protein [Dehalococcoidia bacterium]
MGSEAVSRVSFKGQVSEGKALLETAEIIFRGADFRLRIPFGQIASLNASDGELHVGYDGGVAVFELGRDAEKWAEKIRNPRGLLDKLGVKPGMKVAVLGVEDDDFLAQLRDRVGEPARGEAVSEADFVFYEADRVEDLARLPVLREAIKPAGGVWVVSPKGKMAQIRDVDVMAAAREAGLVDNKVVGFSTTHTALKLVIPKANR